MNTLTELKFLKKNKYLINPKLLQVEITDICPLHCKQCYKDLKRQGEMSYEKILQIINEAKSIGVKKIVLNGGEPLLHSRIIDIIWRISEADIITVCFTSGYGINTIFLKKLEGTKVEFLLSLNGSNKYIHNKSRDGFDITMKAIDLLFKLDIKYSINWVARHDNVKDLINMINLAKRFKAFKINIVANKLTSYGEINSELTKSDYELVREVIKKNDNDKYITIQNCYNILGAFCFDGNVPKMTGCNAGKTFCAITKKGEFLPCTHLYHREAFENIQDYWKNSKVLYKLRNNSNDNSSLCNKCLYKNRCRPCRAMNKELHDNLSLPIKNCLLFQGKYGGEKSNEL